MVNDISALAHAPKMFFKNGSMPVQLTYFVTTRCNASCPHCFYAAELNNPQKHDLSLEEVERISKSMDDLLLIYIGGGEPFLRTDLPEIVEIFCRNNHTRIVSIPTNGFLPALMLPSIERMCQKCPSTSIHINVSIDDIGEAHEKFRKVPGGWNKLLQTMDGIKELKKKYSNLSLGCNATFHHFNQDRFKEIYFHMRDVLRPDSININLVRGKPKDPVSKDIDIAKYREVLSLLQADLRQSRLAVTKSSFQSLINENQARAKELIYNTYITNKPQIECTAGRLAAVIYPDGDVYPCELLEDPAYKLGNLRENGCDFRALWSSAKAHETAKWIVETKCFCTHECFMSLNTMFTPSEVMGSALSLVTKKKN